VCRIALARRGSGNVKRARVSTNAGFATLARGTNKWKMRIVVHRELDEKSRYGVLCHELAHIYLGHLGSDKDHWWASRSGLNGRAIEIEAETVAFIVTTRLGLWGSSAAYVSRYLGKEKELPDSVSLDLIAKVAGRIEEMSQRTFPARRPWKTAKPEAKPGTTE
jgi:antirestriction protein ArdC